MNSESFKNIAEGLKSFGLLILVVIVAILLFVFYKGIRDKQAAVLDQQILNQGKVISELKKALKNAPATGKVVYVYRDRPSTGQAVTSTVIVPQPVLIAKDALCTMAKQSNISVKATVDNEYVHCETDICDPSKASIDLKSAFYDELNKAERNSLSVWRVSGVAGYEAIGSKLSLGVSFIDWHNLIVGTDVNVNFKAISDATIGIFAGYRPVLWGRKINASLFAGPAYSIKGWQAQAGIYFHWYN